MDAMILLVLILTGGGTTCFVAWCRMRAAVDTNEKVLEHKFKMANLEARVQAHILGDGK